RRAIRQNLPALFRVRGVRITGLGARSLLDRDFHTRFREVGNHGGNQRNPALSRKTLFRYTYNHHFLLRVLFPTLAAGPGILADALQKHLFYTSPWEIFPPEDERSGRISVPAKELRTVDESACNR